MGGGMGGMGGGMGGMGGMMAVPDSPSKITKPSKPVAELIKEVSSSDFTVKQAPKQTSQSGSATKWLWLKKKRAISN